MGKARAGTESNAERRFGIRVTEHALEAVRDRLNELGSLNRFSSEPDISLSLRIAEAVHRGERCRYLCDGEQHEVVSLIEALECDLWAFCRSNRVLSVLKGMQVRRSIDSGNWQQTGRAA